jgi:hypothetical protein
MTRKKVLVHICCGICASYCIDKLKEQNLEVTGSFFNPNIHPEEEYIRRKHVAQYVTNLKAIKLVQLEYAPSIWIDRCGEYKHEKEGGKRCRLCYELRLKETFNLCQQERFDYFTTTLTISPQKMSQTIFEIGTKLGKDKFLSLDFKKQDGFKKTISLAKEHNLYRQNYCGCLYSKK